MDFEERIERGADAEKWKGAKEKDELPLWVADMDFACSDAITAALHARADERIYGYTSGMDDAYKTIVRAYYERHFGWHFPLKDLFFSQGIVQAISILVQLLSRPGEGIVIQTPVYHPFRRQIEANHRTCVTNPLIRHADGSYTMDLDDLRKKLSDPSVAGMILCSPHNPVGRVWTPEELKQVSAIAQEQHKWIISDEIHCDIVKAGHTHHMLESMAEEAARDRIITCVAPTKTFNIAGLECSHIIIHDATIRQRWKEFVIDQLCISAPNCFAISAARAAYADSDEWRAAMNRKIDENEALARAFLAEELPQAVLSPREGTYLLWLDLSAYESDPKRLEQRMRQNARVHFNEGVMFGAEGACFERINIACPSSILMEALRRMAAELRKQA